MNTPLLSDPGARASSDSTGGAPQGGFADLVPELSVSDIQESLSFWRDLLGFEVAYDRPDARFAYLVRGRLQVMLCELNGRWETAEMQRPFGRGINFQMAVDRIEPMLKALDDARWPLYEQPNEVWYRVGDLEVGQREFLVQDPDGYLMRFVERLGTRVPS
ncbi:catechol 2,3-dioxygenase-like lactoylglutathione lyase family enzyme [Bradyrhizobium diazoefficiens]|jgi:catechol 2,3-dioxygenase-like lactoylglutathione lyase family enzyme|uniref:Bleomycin resistance protein n=2 Tax=Bradyrhizobium diazoefficiens TaxID=1355477 RepID=A0A837CMN1_9BRAD|nr:MULTISPECIES: VOC family protein [Bradyrhizobium]APO53579.1 glyoxalase [Bradyrhizobium diazoefficiens]KGJ69903.1 putative glyoxalase/bleomycin resistance protein/dioxygenase [Bradyrhizobium diazoefficiens SEMIA 5080]MBR0865308.1 VOC family protein [Bradyrhizobium diazoefficiens]MBR0889885.1 VOC family protein [Bradyrhizobium diazoefficiens]MBR0921593.1 VOC family protein [Bradyrhizobium diazoefficiens]